jgi:hypothetical protein
VPAARKVWEDQILRELAVDEESPAIQSMRNQMKKEILSGGEEKQNTEPVKAPTSLDEFADLSQKSEPTPIKKDAKTKKIKEDEIIKPDASPAK